jgi:hypothetical protein
LICFVADIGIAIRGPRVGGGVAWPRGWSEELRDAAFIATVAAVAHCIVQVVLGRNVPSGAKNVMICDTCHRVRRRDGATKCECGGTFDDFDKWTWIDGGKEEDES